MRTAALFALLAASLGFAAEKPKLVVLDIAVSEPGQALIAETAQKLLLADLAATRLVDPISKSEIATLLGIERQKQLMGCADESSSCLEEISGALGAAWIVSGTLSRVSGQRRFDLTLLDARSSRVAARAAGLFDKDADLEPTIHTLAEQLARGLPGANVRGKVPVPAWLLIAAGAVGAGVGGGLLGDYYTRGPKLQRDINAGMYTVTDAVVARQSVYGEGTAAAVCVAAGLTVVAAGVIWGLLARYWPQ